VGRIVNTQDVLQAALLPASLVLAGWLLLTALLARSERATGATEWTSRQRWTLLLVPTLITAMLVGVASGRLRAVEAAASAGMLLLLWGLASRQLRWPLLRRALDDAMSLTGALFALLLAATTFSLLLRAFGTDRLVGQAMLALQGHPLLALGAVLSTLLACAFVLDAFELIFLVVPIVMPPLLAQVDDAAWVATLVLLVLQAGFLLPPVGYAVVLARGQVRPRPAVGALARALWPYLAWAGAVLLLVVAWPQSTKWLRSDSTTSSAPILDPGDVERLMREMSAPIRP
jgi:TRAP-type mannitol/chloroaromatic compound transport system permease large subunit